jgi:acyl-CoA reductase-like NAD-dependent aldehyde dehydrogenase
LANRTDAERAVAAAQSGRASIARLSVWERARLCNAIGDVIERRREELAKLVTLEQGKPYHTEALAEADGAAAAFRWAGEQIKWLETAAFPVEDRNKRAYGMLQPNGVFAVITPWNCPLAHFLVVASTIAIRLPE